MRVCDNALMRTMDTAAVVRAVADRHAWGTGFGGAHATLRALYDANLAASASELGIDVRATPPNFTRFEARAVDATYHPPTGAPRSV